MPITEIPTIARDNRSSPEYKAWRKEIFKRDKYTCQVCGDKNHIEAHHIMSYVDNPELRITVNNGVTLCSKCHTSFHAKYGKGNNTREQYCAFKSGVRLKGRPRIELGNTVEVTLEDIIINSLEMGSSVKTACKHAHISTPTFRKLYKENADFAMRVTEARKAIYRFASGKLMDNIDNNDQRAIEFFLKTRISDFQENNQEEDDFDETDDTITYSEIIPKDETPDGN